MKRLRVDIPDVQAYALAELARRRGRSRATTIRDAITVNLEAQRGDEIADAFGLWASQPVDGLAHVRQMRAEW